MEPKKNKPSFNEIPEVPIESVERQRLLDRQSRTQSVVLQGNKIIEIKDGDRVFIKIDKDGLILNDGVNDRILIGFQEGGF